MTTPSSAERARTLLEDARVGTLTTFSRARSTPTLVNVSADDLGRPVVLLTAGSPAAQQLLVRPLATVTVAPEGRGPLLVHGGVHRLPTRDHPSGRWAFRIETGTVKLLDGTGLVEAAAYSCAAPDPLRTEAAAVLEHLRVGHSPDLLACVRAHVLPDAAWVVPTGLDRCGLEMVVLLEDGVTRTRLDFAAPVRRLEDLRDGLHATLRCRCQP